MVTCLDRLGDTRHAVRMQAGKQNRTFDLRARRFRVEIDGGETRGAAYAQGWPAVLGRNPGAHPLERHDDAAHRPPAQRVVTGDLRGKRLARENSGQHPHGCARISSVQRRRRREQRAWAAADDAHMKARVVLARHLDRDSERTQAGECRGAVGAGRIPLEGGLTVGDGGEHRIAMRDGFVAGRPHVAIHARRGMHDDGLRRTHRRTITGGRR